MKSLVTVLILIYSSVAVCDWRFGAGLGYSPNITVAMKGPVRSSGTISNVDYEIMHKGGLTLELSAYNLPANDWGMLGGLSLGTKRDADTVTINGSTYSVGGEPATTQSHSLYFGAAYRWNIFYLPFGLNISKTTFTPSPASESSATYNDGFGLFFGVGWLIYDETLAVEFFARANTGKLNIEATDNSGNYARVDGTTGSSVLSLKYLF